MFLLISFSSVYLFIQIRCLEGSKLEVIGFDTSFSCQFFLSCVSSSIFTFVSALVVIPLVIITSFCIIYWIKFVLTIQFLGLLQKNCSNSFL